MNNEKQIITYGHPRFDEFITRLSNAVTWCDNSHDGAIEILNGMPNIDIPGTLEWFESEGGHCDCEICMNVYAPREVRLREQMEARAEWERKKRGD